MTYIVHVNQKWLLFRSQLLKVLKKRTKPKSHLMYSLSFQGESPSKDTVPRSTTGNGVVSVLNKKFCRSII